MASSPHQQQGAGNRPRYTEESDGHVYVFCTEASEHDACDHHGDRRALPRERRAHPGKKGSLIGKGELIVRLVADTAWVWREETAHGPDRIGGGLRFGVGLSNGRNVTVEVDVEWAQSPVEWWLGVGEVVFAVEVDVTVPAG